MVCLLCRYRNQAEISVPKSTPQHSIRHTSNAVPMQPAHQARQIPSSDLFLHTLTQQLTRIKTQLKPQNEAVTQIHTEFATLITTIFSNQVLLQKNYNLNSTSFLSVYLCEISENLIAMRFVSHRLKTFICVKACVNLCATRLLFIGEREPNPLLKILPSGKGALIYHSVNSMVCAVCRRLFLEIKIKMKSHETKTASIANVGTHSQNLQISRIHHLHGKQ